MSDFTASMDQQLEGIEHVSSGAIANCGECWDGFTDQDDDEARELAEEPSFSRYSCDGCGSVLGGDRHPAHGVLTEDRFSPEDQIIHLDICTDCLLYLANGDEPEDWS